MPTGNLIAPVRPLKTVTTRSIGVNIITAASASARLQHGSPPEATVRALCHFQLANSPPAVPSWPLTPRRYHTHQQPATNFGASYQDTASYQADIGVNKIAHSPLTPHRNQFANSPARHISSMWWQAAPAVRTQPQSNKQNWKLVCALLMGPLHASCPQKAG